MFLGRACVWICLPRTFQDADIWRRSGFWHHLASNKISLQCTSWTFRARYVCWCAFHDGPLYREIFILSLQIPNVLRQFSFLLIFDMIEWVKRSTDPMFDVTMGSSDGAEICELVDLFLLNKLVLQLGNCNVGHYRDDGLALIPGTNGRDADVARKRLVKVFDQVGLRITAEVNHQIVNFLDITLNLNSGKFTHYRKPNNVNPQYIDSRSNYHLSIIKQVPKSINQRISSPCPKIKQSFDTCKPVYESALKESNYNVSLEYSNRNPTSTPTSSSTKQKRHRAIIWFNPPFRKSAKRTSAENFYN